MACAGCDSCGDGLYQVHVTLGRHPGSKLRLTKGYDFKVHVLVNLLPNGRWRKEWVTTTNIKGTEREAVLHMRDMARAAKAIHVPVHRQKIEVPAFKLPEGRGVLYVEAHCKALLSMTNLDTAIKEGRNVSVNVEKPGNLIVTFRRPTWDAVKQEVGEADMGRFLGFNSTAPVQYEAAIHDDNPDSDNDWMRPWRTS
jgi:hypothetical protein